MVSALYIPNYSFYSMWKASELVIDVLVIAVVLSHPRPQASARIAYNTVLTLFAVLMVVYWVEALVVPSAAFLPSRGLIPYTLQGVMPIMNGNAVAFMTAVLAFAAWCPLLRRGIVRRVFWLLVLGSALGMLILAQSRTSLIGLMIAVAIQLFFDRRFGLLLLLSILAALVAASAQISTVTEEYLVRGQSRELVSSLSGRTQGWEAAWASFQQSPVIGRGFAAAARAEILGTTGASTLHGAVFDVLVGVGLLGFIPWAAAILWTIVQLLGLGRRGLSRRRVGNLDRSATANLKPELEIYADDVKCAHGATVGELDARALFYMQSRGVPTARAKALLLEAFIASAFAGIVDDVERERVEAAASAALARLL